MLHPSIDKSIVLASCQPYGIDILPKGWYDTSMQPPGLHESIMTIADIEAFKHQASLEGIAKYI